MYTKDYIQATYEVLKKGDADATLSALSVYLKKRGLTKLIPGILRGLIERIQRSNLNTVPKVVVARKEDFKKHEDEIDSFLKELEGNSKHSLVIDKNIIGGFSIEWSNKRIDKSYKKELLHTYHRLLGITN